MLDGSDPREARRHARQRDIQRMACRLVVQCGYDGFTMADLAQAVGVSRRTLFNHFPDKASAVLGSAEQDLTHVEVFLVGGPTGNLQQDLLALILTTVGAMETADPAVVERHELREGAIAADLKVRRLADEQFTAHRERLIETICRRQGWRTGDLRARAISATTFALVELSMAEYRTRLQERVIEPAPGTFARIIEEVFTAHRNAPV